MKLDGVNKHAALRAECRAQRGAPVAWLDGNGEVIASFGRVAPPGAKGGLINVGKVYRLRDQAVNASPPSKAAPEPPKPPALEPTADARRKTRQARARSVIRTRLRGCLLARGWRHIPGPFGYWERGDQTVDDNFEGMIEALLLDRQWAAAYSAEQSDVLRSAA